MNTQVVQPTARNVQTNAPEYQKLLKEKGRDGLPSKLRSQIPEFRTPQVPTQSRVIHKEKLNLPSGGSVRSVSPNRSFTAVGSASRSEAAPVAHVQPHSSSGQPPGAPGRVSAPGSLLLPEDPALQPADRLARALADSRLSDPGRPSIAGMWGKPRDTPRSPPMDEMPKTLNDEASLLGESQFKETEYIYKHSTIPRSATAVPYLSSDYNLRPHHRAASLSNQDLSNTRLGAGSLESLNYPHLTKDPFSVTAALGPSYQYPSDYSADYRNTSDPYSLVDRPPTYGAGYSTRDLGRTCAYNELLYPPRESSYTSVAESDSLTNDITSWQQKHQEQLKQQHLEVSRPMQSLRSRSLTHIPQVQDGDSAAARLTSPDPHRLDALQRAADSIIREKDMIIEKQKMTLQQQEKMLKEAEFLQHPDYNMQEQYQSGSHSRGFRSFYIGDAAELEKKLGQTEYEFREYRKQVEKTEKEKDRRFKELQDKMDSKDADVAEWKKKCEEAVKKQETTHAEMGKLKNYIADLPTPDESTKRKEEVQALKHSRNKYKTRVADLENELLETKKAVRSREDLIESVEQGNKELEQQIGELKETNRKLEEQLSSDVQLAEVQRENEQLKELNERLSADCDKARKLLEAKHKKLQSLEARQHREKSEVEERLSQEEAAVLALREEMVSKDQMLSKLRSSAKELGSQNQDLMSKNLVLQDRVRELEKQHGGDVVKQQQWLMRELSVCFTELESLVQVCVQRAEGQDPNISVLLGPKPGVSVEPQEGAQDAVQSLKHKVTRVKELRKNVEALRAMIANKYAEDMGDNLTCATQ